MGAWRHVVLEIGDPDLERVAGFFGLTGTILDLSKALHIVPLQEVAHGPCATPPAGALPPGTPRDDTFVNPPFVPWAQRYDEPGYNFDFSYSPHTARAKLAVGVDEHLWAVASPTRAQSIGYPTDPAGTKDFFHATRVFYNKSADLVIAGDDERGSANLAERCFVYSIKPAGAIGFASSFGTTERGCVVGGFAEAANGELLVAATDGRNFVNHGLFIVLDESGTFRRSSSWQLGGSSFIQPTAVLPLPTSGYVIVGQDSVRASREGVFFLRLGALPFAAAADGETGALVAATTVRTITPQAFTPVASPVSVPLAPVELKNETLPTAGTSFAP